MKPTMRSHELSGIQLAEPDLPPVVIEDDDRDPGPSRPDRGTRRPLAKAASTLGSCSNLANTILGAGMLGLPHAFAEAGWVPGILMLILFGGFGALGLHLLAEAADRAGRPCSFYSVAEAAMPGAGLVIDFAIGIKCFGVATSYLIVVGDSMPRAMDAAGGAGLLLERRFWTLVAAAMVAPLCFQRRVDALKFTSMLSLACVLFVVLLVFLFAEPPDPSFDPCEASPPALPPVPPPHPTLAAPEPPFSPPSPPSPPPCRLPTELTGTPVHVLRAVPIFVFSYTCHQNIISISNELCRPTPSRVGRVILLSVGFALLIYLVVAIAGYETFGLVVSSDILSTYPSSGLVAVARLAISVVVTFSYPLQSHPSRGCVLSLLSAASRKLRGVSKAPNRLAAESASPTTYALVTSAFLLASTSIALFVDDLGLVLSFVGATGSTIVSYVLPGGTYFFLVREGRKRWLGFAQLAMGCVLMPLSLALLVTKPTSH